jgi:hypothetical protein
MDAESYAKTETEEPRPCDYRSTGYFVLAKSLLVPRISSFEHGVSMDLGQGRRGSPTRRGLRASRAQSENKRQTDPNSTGSDRIATPFPSPEPRSSGLSPERKPCRRQPSSPPCPPPPSDSRRAAPRRPCPRPRPIRGTIQSRGFPLRRIVFARKLYFFLVWFSSATRSLASPCSHHNAVSLSLSLSLSPCYIFCSLISSGKAIFPTSSLLCQFAFVRM